MRCKCNSVQFFLASSVNIWSVDISKYVTAISVIWNSSGSLIILNICRKLNLGFAATAVAWISGSKQFVSLSTPPRKSVVVNLISLAVIPIYGTVPVPSFPPAQITPWIHLFSRIWLTDSIFPPKKLHQNLCWFEHFCLTIFKSHHFYASRLLQQLKPEAAGYQIINREKSCRVFRENNKVTIWMDGLTLSLYSREDRMAIKIVFTYHLDD